MWRYKQCIPSSVPTLSYFSVLPVELKICLHDATFVNSEPSLERGSTWVHLGPPGVHQFLVLIYVPTTLLVWMKSLAPQWDVMCRSLETYCFLIRFWSFSQTFWITGCSHSQWMRDPSELKGTVHPTSILGDSFLFGCGFTTLSLGVVNTAVCVRVCVSRRVSINTLRHAQLLCDSAVTPTHTLDFCTFNVWFSSSTSRVASTFDLQREEKLLIADRRGKYWLHHMTSGQGHMSN